MNIHEVDTDKVDISHQIDDAEKKYIDISGKHRIIFIQYLNCIQT